jgi:hypothetical protein
MEIELLCKVKPSTEKAPPSDPVWVLSMATADALTYATPSAQNPAPSSQALAFWMLTVE